MVNFPVLSYGYSLVNFPRERTAIQVQKFGKSEYADNLTLFLTIPHYSSKSLLEFTQSLCSHG